MKHEPESIVERLVREIRARAARDAYGERRLHVPQSEIEAIIAQVTRDVLSAETLDEVARALCAKEETPRGEP